MGCDQIKKLNSEIQVLVAGNSYQEEYVILLVKLRPRRLSSLLPYSFYLASYRLRLWTEAAYTANGMKD